MISNFKVFLHTKEKKNMCDFVLTIIGEGNKTNDESRRNSELGVLRNQPKHGIWRDLLVLMDSVDT